jgi:hypothetical protein
MINYSPPPDVFLFNLVANSPGWNASQIGATLTGSSEFTIQGSTTGHLDDNLNDLRPRNHLYITSGVTNLPLSFTLDTSTMPDGFHELTAVAYEGSHVRTQTRLSQVVRVQNTSLAANFNLESGSTNVGLGSTLAFGVAANTNNISSIQLFSTGGVISNVLNQATASFSVPANTLGAGLHPFYALVTAGDGAQYRTETLWIVIQNSPSAFPLTITGPPVALSWPAKVGQGYGVLATTDLASGFQLVGSVIASNSTATWTDSLPSVSQRFYRVQTSD